MKICIPTRDDTGLDAECDGHFGRAPYFTLVDTERDGVLTLENGGGERRHGTCHPLQHLREHHLDAIVCSGIGRGAYSQLRAQGLDVYTTPRATVAEILAAARAGTLRRVEEDGTCSGGGHHAGPCGGHHE